MMTPDEFTEHKKKLQDIYMPNAYLDQILNWTLEQYTDHIKEMVEQLKVKWDCPPFSKLCKKKGKTFCFVTINFDEANLSKGTPLQIVQKICSWSPIHRFAYAFEWRDHDAETGLHCHLILVGNTKKIVQNLKKQKGPFIKLCKEYGTLLKYPIKFLSDKVKYINGETYDESKNDKKSRDDELRLKHNLLSVNNL